MASPVLIGPDIEVGIGYFCIACHVGSTLYTVASWLTQRSRSLLGQRSGSSIDVVSKHELMVVVDLKVMEGRWLKEACYY